MGWPNASKLGQHGVVTDKSSEPLEKALEVAFYAPLGFALEARRLMPSFVARGKAQVEMAKVMGQFAVQMGSAKAKESLSDAQLQAEALLERVANRDSGRSKSSSNGVDSSAAETKTAPFSKAAEPVAKAVQEVEKRSSGPGADDLAISNYDSLAASQVVPRLAGLGSEELEAVRNYEQNHRGRKTILGKIAQLQDS